jgi:hypothetical protein
MTARPASRCSFGANALTKLIIEHDIKLKDIARIYGQKAALIVQNLSPLFY